LPLDVRLAPHPPRCGEAGPASCRLREAHPAVSLFWVTLDIRELDCLELMLQSADPDGGSADQAAAAVPGAGDPASVVDVDPGS
jgi:hypothetical protein